ncbi:MAG: hypothetical protein ACK5HR_03090 [Mycoplasmatales bacterium]
MAKNQDEKFYWGIIWKLIIMIIGVIIIIFVSLNVGINIGLEKKEESFIEGTYFEDIVADSGYLKWSKKYLLFGLFGGVESESVLYSEVASGGTINESKIHFNISTLFTIIKAEEEGYIDITGLSEEKFKETFGDPFDEDKFSDWQDEPYYLIDGKYVNGKYLTDEERNDNKRAVLTRINLLHLIQSEVDAELGL